MSSFPYFNPYRDGHRNISELWETKGALRCRLAIMASFSSSGLGNGPSFLLHGDQCCESPQALGRGRIFGRSLGRRLAGWQDQITSKTWLGGHWASGHFSMTNQYTLSISGINQLIWPDLIGGFVTQSNLRKGVFFNSNSRSRGVFPPYGPTVKWENRIGPYKDWQAASPLVMVGFFSTF